MSALVQSGVTPGARARRPVSRLPLALAGASILAAVGLAPAWAGENVKIQPIKITAPHAATHGDAASRPHVYLMRGLMNIFSLGMDQLGAQIAGNGIDASVYNHSVAETVVQIIVQKFRAGDHGPYILVGHSLGADAVMTMAQQLNVQGVPVALVVPFDGTGSYAATANVACVLNLTQRQYAYMQPGAGFHGKLSNVDLSSDTSIDHFTIDKSPRLQAMALKEILQAAHGQSCRPNGGAPVIARSKESPAPNTPVSKQAAPAKIPADRIPADKSASPDESVSPAKSASPALRSG